MADRTSLAPSSGALFGVNLDLAAKPLGQYATELGRKPAVSMPFVDFPHTDQERTNLQQAAQIRTDGQQRSSRTHSTVTAQNKITTSGNGDSLTGTY